TRDNPRAIVLVNACWRTLTAFSQGEVPCAKAEAARSRPATTTHNWRNLGLSRSGFRQIFVILVMLLILFTAVDLEIGRVPAVSPMSLHRADVTLRTTVLV